MTTAAPDDFSSSAPSFSAPIRWPERYLPARAAVFAHNEIVIPAPPERIWPWLIRADLWPTWYSNSSAIHFLSHTGPDLRDRSRFRWKTSNLRITSKVLEFEPCARIAWDCHGIGFEAYHAWVLTPLSADSTHVVCEETQNGWLARFGKLVSPGHVHSMHQMWLEGLSARAESGQMN